MKKRWFVLVGALVIVFILAMVFKPSPRGTPYVPPTPPQQLSVEIAQLQVDSGIVMVNQGSGWQKINGELSLTESDRVKTEEGSATIIFYDTIIVTLDPNTEVSISELSKEKVQINQAEGSTWNKFIGVTGVEGYEVVTPNTVATVRGTEFGINVGTESIIVAEGKVDFSDKQTGQRKSVGKAEKYRRERGQITKDEIDSQDKQRVVKGIVKSMGDMKKIRTKRMSENNVRISEEQMDKMVFMDQQRIQQDPQLRQVRSISEVNNVQEALRTQMDLLKEIDQNDEMRQAIHEVMQEKQYKEILRPMADIEPQFKQIMERKPAQPEYQAEYQEVENQKVETRQPIPQEVTPQKQKESRNNTQHYDTYNHE